MVSVILFFFVVLFKVNLVNGSVYLFIFLVCLSMR